MKNRQGVTGQIEKTKIGSEYNPIKSYNQPSGMLMKKTVKKKEPSGMLMKKTIRKK